MTYLLDSDVCIEVMRRRDRPLLQRVLGRSDLAVSVVTVSELERGGIKSGEDAYRETIDLFLGAVDTLDLDRPAAEHAADIRVALERRGTPIGPYDVLIAGHARSRGLVLVTRNDLEFRRVEGLRVERW